MQWLFSEDYLLTILELLLIMRKFYQFQLGSQSLSPYFQIQFEDSDTIKQKA